MQRPLDGYGKSRVKSSSRDRGAPQLDDAEEVADAMRIPLAMLVFGEMLAVSQLQAYRAPRSTGELGGRREG